MMVTVLLSFKFISSPPPQKKLWAKNKLHALIFNNIHIMMRNIFDSTFKRRSKCKVNSFAIITLDWVHAKQKSGWGYSHFILIYRVILKKPFTLIVTNKIQKIRPTNFPITTWNNEKKFQPKLETGHNGR